MALPYPILDAGGAVVVDSSKAAQISWNAIHDNLDLANANMKQRQEATAKDYNTLKDLSEKSSQFDSHEINAELEGAQSWYADQLGKGRNPNTAKFIKEFNEKLINIETMNGRAQARANSYNTNIDFINNIKSGYYKKDKILLELMKNNGTPLSQWNSNMLPELLDDAENYDLEAKMGDLADIYRKGFSEEVTDYKKDGDWYRYSQLFNPAIHSVEIIDGKETLVYELKEQEYSKLMNDDEGFAKSVNGEVEAEIARIEEKFDNITSREAAGEVVPESEQLTAYEEKFAGSGLVDKGRHLLTQRLKGIIGTTMKDIQLGATEEKKQANRLQLAEARSRLAMDKAMNRPMPKWQADLIGVAEEQDAVYSSVVDERLSEGMLNSLVQERETGGGVVRESFETERTEDGLIRVTYRTRSTNEYRYKNVLREKTVYLDPNDRGAILNFTKEMGRKGDWTTQKSTGTADLPESTTKEIGFEEEGIDNGKDFKQKKNGATGEGKTGQPPGA